MAATTDLRIFDGATAMVTGFASGVVVTMPRAGMVVAPGEPE